ncbi:late competence development ComFB family protein [Leptolyngbya ohadii]|uniref:late competence development ComFB family protein n=1 Tax=Leptolyngbya ohadii TaxID=1962290 RepID=UPI000B59A33A|nr:late competence development ComFB family protein [Leptolyngbya ohadii]
MGTYKNIMEMLVEEEVIRQCKALPSRSSSYFNSEELIAYALNQLPPLYATSEQGLQYQLQKGRAKFGPQITQAVQRAIAAVRRDPLRRNTPLEKGQAVPLNNVLQQMRQLLRDEDIEWETLPMAVERAIKRVAFRAARGASANPVTSGAANQAPTPDRTATVSRSSQVRAAAETRPNSEGLTDDAVAEYGWDNPLYFSR